jgi:3-oxoacyl-[acyl-carrier-protein] synthase III
MGNDHTSNDGAQVRHTCDQSADMAVICEKLENIESAIIEIKSANKVFMEGREVFKFAVKIQGEATERVLAKCGLTTADVDLIVPHQANMRIIESAVKRLGLPLEKFFVNLDRYGNTSSTRRSPVPSNASGTGMKSVSSA